MLEGLFQPYILLFVGIFVVGIPVFIVLRLLWKAGTRLGRPPEPPK
jgi:hypothetical protein